MPKEMTLADWRARLDSLLAAPRAADPVWREQVGQCAAALTAEQN